MYKCLVLEDSEVIRFVAARIIENLGHSVLQADNAKEAIMLIEAEKPDVVFLDWDMPGLEALSFLKSLAHINELEKPQVVLCATENDAQQFALARAAGAAHHILKPYDIATIRAILIKAGIHGSHSDEMAAVTALGAG